MMEFVSTSGLSRLGTKEASTVDPSPATYCIKRSPSSGIESKQLQDEEYIMTDLEPQA